MSEEPTLDDLRHVVRLRIDGEERELRYPIGALKRLVEHLGIDGLAALPRTLAAVSLESLGPFVWAGLLWQEPQLTVEEVEGRSFAYVEAVGAVVSGVNLALWGRRSGAPRDEDEEHEEAAGDTADPPSASPGGDFSASEPAGSA